MPQTCRRRRYKGVHVHTIQQKDVGCRRPFEVQVEPCKHCGNQERAKKFASSLNKEFGESDFGWKAEKLFDEATVLVSPKVSEYRVVDWMRRQFGVRVIEDE